MREAIGRVLDQLGTTTKAAESLVAYAALVQEWNQRLNLTGADGAGDLADVLVADSAALATLTEPMNVASLLDVGSGAGSPALPYALLKPTVRATLVEPLRKRVTFLRLAVGSLGLAERVRVLESNIDVESPSVPGAPFDFAISRATFAPEVWLGVGLKLAAHVAVFTREDAPAAPPGTRVVASHDYALPFAGSPRCITIFAREASR
ncbi:MAG: RsmG family class I SAM-dependent methyltransferase [Polyangiales bacterium]|nr:class I SAM-dependent methyltransferase [Myxococcales bacterium]